MNNRVVWTLLAGAAIGVMVGMALAPEKSDEIGKKVKDGAEDLFDRAEDLFDKLRRKAADKLDDLEKEIGRLRDTVAARGNQYGSARNNL